MLHVRACNPQSLFFCHLKTILIIWQSEETYKSIFYNKSETIQYAIDLMRRGVVLCALCFGYFNYHGCYDRNSLYETGDGEKGWIVQVCCPVCNKYPSLIPDFIMPYKHYAAKVIEAVINEHEKGGNVEQLGGFSADVSTMRRWIRQFEERGTRAVGQLLSILYALYNQHISILKFQHKSLLKQLARLLREFHLAESGGIIGRVNIILTTQNCGFL